MYVYITGVSTVALLCSLFSTYLLNTVNYDSATPQAKQLFTVGLEAIKTLASNHPQQFKVVTSNSPPLRSAIEQAFLLHQSNEAAAQKKAAEASKQKQQAKPAIQLKMNFGNFT